MRLVLLIIAISAGIFAQDESKPAILVQGVVVDKITHAPIAGARVEASLGSFQVNSGVVTSGSGGDFQVRLSQGDKLSISASAPAYQNGQILSRKIDPDQSSIYVEVELTRFQSVRGVLVDEETRKPLPSLAVELVFGEPSLAAQPIAQRSKISGSDGGFLFFQVPRGEYFLRISDKPAPAIGQIPAKDLEGPGRDKALETPEGAPGYGTIVWPGRNADVPTVPGIQVGASPVDVGEIRLSRTKLQNLSGLVGPCEDGASIQIIVSRPSNVPSTAMLANRDITCGDGFQLLNLPDGGFTVSAVQGFPQRRWVSERSTHVRGDRCG